jgi:hypothetical protein
MLNQEIKKIRHNIPELSEWSDDDIKILNDRVGELKSQWRKLTNEYDTFLTLGAALSWSETSQSTPGLPELSKSPSQYIEVGQLYREELERQSKSLAEKAQAWGGFWDPEDEKKEDEQGWKERSTSIAPHVWIGLKKRGFLPHINTPLEYERQSLQGLEKCCSLFLRLPKLTPDLETMRRGHRTLFKNISDQAGEFTNTQLFTAGYVGSDPRLISYELESIKKQYKKGMATANKMGLFKDAEILRTVTFACARLLRVQAFKDGNKRLIAAWALCALAREINMPKQKDITFWKNLHHHFKDIRKGKLGPTCKKLCQAFGIENPEREVPSFWLSPDNVAPSQIDPKEWESKGSKNKLNNSPHTLQTHNLAPKILQPKKKYKAAQLEKRSQELEFGAGITTI